MRTSATGKLTEGLTLIELVVVVAILGLVSLPVMLRLGGGGVFGGVTPAQTAQARLAAELAQMRDRALFARQIWRLSPHPHGWDWLSPVPGRTPGSGPDGSARFDGLTLIWQVDHRANTDPVVHLMPDGRGTPFSVRLGAEGAICRFDGWGEMACADR